MRSILIKTRHVIPSIFASLLLLLGTGISYAADSGNGGGLYAKNCATCHGKSGTSVMPNAPNFALGESLMQPDAKLLASIRTGKNSMPGYRGILKDAEIMDVIAFIRTFH